MVNSISGSFSNLDFLDNQRISREKMLDPSLVDTSEMETGEHGGVEKKQSSLTVSNQSTNNKVTMQLGVTGVSTADMSSLSYRPSIRR